MLAAELPGLVSSLSFKKSMRWDGFGVAYSRPMRWLMALHGSRPISFSYGGLVSAPSTRVLRNAPQPQLQVRFVALVAIVMNACRAGNQLRYIDMPGCKGQARAYMDGRLVAKCCE